MWTVVRTADVEADERSVPEQGFIDKLSVLAIDTCSRGNVVSAHTTWHLSNMSYSTSIAKLTALFAVHNPDVSQRSTAVRQPL